MPPPSLRMRPFRNKGDIIRMMQRLMGSASQDLESLDPLTLAAFLGKSDGFPGFFATYRPVVNAAAAQVWEWFADPAAAVINDPAGIKQLHKNFWNPGQSILPPVGQAFARTILTGWYFVPSCLTIRYYTVLNVAKNGLTDTLRYFGAYLPDRDPGTLDPADSFILGQSLNATPRPIQVFGLSPTLGSGAGSSVHMLYPMALLPGARIDFGGFTGLIDTDNVALNMCGTWRFSPRLIDDAEERNG